MQVFINWKGKFNGNKGSLDKYHVYISSSPGGKTDKTNFKLNECDLIAKCLILSSLITVFPKRLIVFLVKVLFLFTLSIRCKYDIPIMARACVCVCAGIGRDVQPVG